jgi:hypothetical protein
VKVGRELLADQLSTLPGVQAIVADRGFAALAAQALEAPHQGPPKGTVGFTPLAPLYKVEHSFAQLVRWRRLSRCYAGTEASARASLEVASFGTERAIPRRRQEGPLRNA